MTDISNEACAVLEDLGIDSGVLDDDHPADMVLLHVAQQYAAHREVAYTESKKLAEKLDDALDLTNGSPLLVESRLCDMSVVRRHDEAWTSMDALRSTLRVAAAAYRKAHGLPVTAI